MRTVTALVFDGFQILDLMGPLEFIGNLPDDFRIRIAAQAAGPVRSHAEGVDVLTHHALSEVSDGTDILLIPGGQGTRREVSNDALIDWIADQSEQAEIVATVCTGAALLAAMGLLDGRKATTNKKAFEWVAQGRPAVQWQRRARWVEDGKYFTSSGVSAGMDLTLALLARLLGRDRAVEVAGWAEYVWNDDPENDPFALA